MPSAAPSPPGGSPAAADPVQSLVAGLRTLYDVATHDQTGIAAAGAVVIAGAVLSWLTWGPFSEPSRAIGGLVDPGNCVSLEPGTLPMYGCSIRVGLLTLIGPLLIVGVLVLMRPLLRWVVAAVTRLLPAGARFLVPSLVATALFTLAWAGVHWATGDLVGLLPQRLFPAAIGLFTFIVIRYDGPLRQSLEPFFQRRAAVPTPVRGVLAILVPLLVALLITNEERVSDTATKEQLVVLVGLCVGYLAFAPEPARRTTPGGPFAASASTAPPATPR